MTSLSDDANATRQTPTPARFTLKLTADKRETALDLLVSKTSLSKSRLKDALNKGAAWLQRKGAGRRRVRRATTDLYPGDRLELNYDERLLAIVPPLGICVKDAKDYSVWFKPPGLMSQGTEFGDHCALQRQVEQHVQPQRKVWLIHRLDQAAAGLIVFAHTAQCAAALNAQFKQHEVTKEYLADVEGDLRTRATSGELTESVDGRAARTLFRVLNYEANRHCTRVEISLETGRFHQIRQHFAQLGFPLVGDRRYGGAMENELRLLATSLTFQWPRGGAPQNFHVRDLVSAWLMAHNWYCDADTAAMVSGDRPTG